MCLPLEDGSGDVEGYTYGVVVGWLGAHESDFVSQIDGAPAPLWHVRYEEGVLAGDEEDLEVRRDDVVCGSCVHGPSSPRLVRVGEWWACSGHESKKPWA